MLKLNIIGCGRAGGTVAHALSATGFIRINQVLNASPASAADAVSSMGTGWSVPHFASFEVVTARNRRGRGECCRGASRAFHATPFRG